jgi:hypothetical protein
MYSEYLYKQPQKKKQFDYSKHKDTINKILNNMKTTKYEHFSLYEEAFINFYEEIVFIHNNIQETQNIQEVSDRQPDVIQFDLKHINTPIKKKKKMNIMEILKEVNI